VKAQFKTAIRAAQKRAAELGEEFGRAVSEAGGMRAARERTATRRPA
jgi:hypothetical protein